ncbi:MAG: glutaminase, partial [Bacteroidales bacterium]
MSRIVSVNQIEDVMNEAYELYRDHEGGKNASYIPYLEQIPTDLFGISICFPNGKIIEVGDTDYAFGIESISKVL